MAQFNLKQVLRQQEMSQYKLAKLLGVSTAEVYRWTQKNYNPTLKTMALIADGLDVSLDDLTIRRRKSR